jgi:hypothetical protein
MMTRMSMGTIISMSIIMTITTMTIDHSYGAHASSASNENPAAIAFTASTLWGPRPWRCMSQRASL